MLLIILGIASFKILLFTFLKIFAKVKKKMILNGISWVIKLYADLSAVILWEGGFTDTICKSVAFYTNLINENFY